MTIYATPFDQVNRECSGPSTDSGFKSIEAVIEALGGDYVTANPMYVIYGDKFNRVVFSNNVKWKQ